MRPDETVDGDSPQPHDVDHELGAGDSGVFQIDLPQYLETEVQRPTARRLTPLKQEPPPSSVWKRLATSWRVKGIVQKVLSALPAGGLLHYELQRRAGGLRDFHRECDTKVDDWRLMMGHLEDAGIDLRQARLLEIGTGWYPTFPICLYLAGAHHVKTVDIARLLKPDLMVRMVERLATHIPLIAHVARRDEASVRANHTRLLGALRRGAPLTAATKGTIDYRAPSDAAHTGLTPSSLDVVFSNSVLEHVQPGVIAACFAESFRILRPGGIVFHSVNCGDHYAYTDRTITQLNYLAFSDEEWAKWNNAFLYQNRLRAADFTALAREAGFRIELDTSRPHPARIAQLERITVHPRFAHYPKAQLAITSIDFIGRKPADATGN